MFIRKNVDQTTHFAMMNLTVNSFGEVRRNCEIMMALAYAR